MRTNSFILHHTSNTMSRVRFLCLAVLPITQANTEVDARSAFEDFKLKWNRHYKDHAEEEHRFKIFEEKLAWITEENTKGHGATMVVNDFTDLTASEFASRFANLNQTKADDVFLGSKWMGYHEIRPNETFADAVDWVAKGAVTPVKNQGQCGSCWAFSTVGVIEGRWQIASGRLISLSESQFVDCDHSDDGCDGGLPPRALQFAEDQAICTESSYPYQARDSACRATSCTAGVPRGSIIGVKQTQRGSASSMMSALNAGPVSVAVDASGAFGSYGGGILTNSCGSQLNHAVLAVGYTSSYWKVKNSWGSSWGESGYIRLSTSGDKCGVLDQGSYPVMSGSPGPSPPGPSPPAPSPPGPAPDPSCRWNSDCPPGQKCYYLSAHATSGTCSSDPPGTTLLV